MARPEWENKFFKLSLVLNAVIMNIFFALNFFTNFGNRSLELAAIYYIIFAISLVLANYVLYLYYKRNKQKLPSSLSVFNFL
jgi:hypothetical protein